MCIRDRVFDLHLGLHHAGLVGLVHEFRGDDGSEDPQNDDDDHQFQQGEPAVVPLTDVSVVHVSPPVGRKCAYQKPGGVH